MNPNSWVDTVFKPMHYDLLNMMPDRKRGDGFLAMFEALDKGERNWQILETGCMRPGGDLTNDGQSTRLFSEYVTAKGGLLISVDLDPNHVAHAEKNTNEKHVRVYCSDSVKFIFNFGDDFVEDIYFRPGLIYLDSYDVDFREPWRSNLHHMKELAALGAAGFLSRGTIVGVDDCLFPADDKRIAPGVDHNIIGKGTFVDSYMADIGAEKIYDGYQKVWIIK